MLTVKKIVRTCGACPTQWEGELEDGREIYCRYRWGYLRVDLAGERFFGVQLDQGETDEEAELHYEDLRKQWPDAAESMIESDRMLRKFAKERGLTHSYAGSLTYDALREATKELFVWPGDEG